MHLLLTDKIKPQIVTLILYLIVVMTRARLFDLEVHFFSFLFDAHRHISTNLNVVVLVV